MSENFSVYRANGNRIFHGNALTVLRSLPRSSIDLIFADPPYNIGKKYVNFQDKWPSEEAYIDWCQQWLEQCITLLKPTGSMYVMASTQSMPFIDVFLRQRMTILSRIVWRYDSSGVQARSYFGSMYEPILHCVKDKSNYTFNASDILVEAKTGAKRKLIDYRKAVPTVYNSEKVPGNVWYFPRVRYRMAEYEDHPSQKPEALLKRIILASSNTGEVVLDPFAGTFTTCKVAKELGRRSIGVELEETYLKIGLRRVGIQDEYRGEKLKPIQKTTKRKNKNGQKQLTAIPPQPSLLDFSE